jgi:hypothetical protein
MQRPREENVADRWPDLALFIERVDCTHCFDFGGEAEEAEEAADKLDGVAGAACFVEAVFGTEADTAVEPVLECLGGEVGGEFCEEEVAEGRMAAFGEELPDVVVGEGGDGGDFELEKVVLIRVEVDGVDATWGFEEIVEDVVACGGDGEDHVGGVDVEDLAVDGWVFPVEGIDVFISELLVFSEEFVVVNAPGVLLVESGGKR